MRCLGADGCQASASSIPNSTVALRGDAMDSLKFPGWNGMRDLRMQMWIRNQIVLPCICFASLPLMHARETILS